MIDIFDISNSFLDAYSMVLTEEESLLIESRIDFIKQSNPEISTAHDMTAEHRDAGSIIDHLAIHADPTPNKAHTQYLVGLYKKGGFHQEDAPRIKTALSNFEKYKGKLKPEDRQLTAKAYPNISDIEDKVAPHLGTMASKAQARKTLDQPGHELRFEDDNIKIYHVGNKQVSQDLYGGGHQRGGTGTSWCTAARSEDNRYDAYRAKGPMYAVHRKSDGAVFQYHPESEQFQDAKNNTISHEDFKSINDSLQNAWHSKPDETL